MSFNIISKILEVYDKNIKFDEEFCENEVIRGVEHKIFQGKLTYEPQYCAHCGKKNKENLVVKNGTQTVNILIGQQNYKPCILRLKKQRFYCKHCNRTFIAKTDIVDENCYISNKVKKYINIDLSENITQKYIAARHSVSSSTVERVLRTNQFKVNKKWLPEVLGIDEFKSIKSVDSNMSVILCDVHNGDIIDIFTDRRKRYLREYFLSFSKEARNMVKYITTDMYTPYIDLARDLFPNAQVVIDKFHIVQLMTRCMQKLRINEMKKLKTNSKEYRKLKRYWKIILKKKWKLNGVEFYKYPCYKKLTNSKEICSDLLDISETLRAGYELYQEFLWIIYSKDSDAFLRFIEKNIYNKNICEEFKTALKTLYTYRFEIINALETGYTNAVVEGNNSMIKAIKKTACGFRSFENMRLRIMMWKKIKIEKHDSNQSVFTLDAVA